MERLVEEDRDLGLVRGLFILEGEGFGVWIWSTLGGIWEELLGRNQLKSLAEYSVV